MLFAVRMDVDLPPDTPGREDLLRALPGYTASDAGAAMVLTAGPAGDGDPGILAQRFVSNSAAWNACTVSGGGACTTSPSTTTTPPCG